MSTKVITMVVSIITSFFFLTTSPAIAQQSNTEIGQFIYQITAEECPQNPNRRLQTGFAVSNGNVTGIVTALHGVIGCKNIIATPDNAIPIRNLEVSHVDIDHDIALLTTQTLPISFSGIKHFISDFNDLNISCESTTSEPVIVLGYPRAANFKEKREGVISCVRNLKQKLSDDPNRTEEYEVQKALRIRNSPHLKIDIFDVKVSGVTHGDSGAPIFKKDTDRLLGVTIGGLGTGNVWGIPWNSITWNPSNRPDIAERLASLQKQALSPSLMSHFGLEPATNEDTPKIQMKNDQPWRGNFILESLTIESEACVIVLTNRYSNNNVVLAEQIFPKADTYSNRIISMIGAPTKEQHGKFCDLIVEAQKENKPITLYAYLVKWDGTTCGQPIITKQNRQVFTRFKIDTLKTKIRQTGFCADSSIWDGVQ